MPSQARNISPQMLDLPSEPTDETRAGPVRRARTLQILEAAEKIFAAKGFEGATTAEIAALAQLPKANIHYYFGTKQNIYRAVLDNILQLWLAEADHWITPHRPPYAALNGYIRAKLTSAREKPEASRIYASELLRGAPHIRTYLHVALRNRVATLSTVIEHWITNGELRQVAPAHLLFCIWAMTQTYADFAVQISAVLSEPHLNDDVFNTAAETITNMVLNSFVIIPDSKGFQ